MTSKQKTPDPNCQFCGGCGKVHIKSLLAGYDGFKMTCRCTLPPPPPPKMIYWANTWEQE